MNKIIYLDNAATTKPLDEVIDIMQETQKTSYGNASSLHELGIQAEILLENSKKMIASAINANENEIIFTSGGTESNNLAILGAIKNKKGRIITTKVEHPSILDLFKSLEKEYDVVFIDVDQEGIINLKQLEDNITNDTLIVSVLHANNEIGTIQNIKEISEVIKNKNPNTILHVDACQSFTKIDIDIKDMNIDLLTLNGHKIHGPKGIGALYVRKGIKLLPIMLGGHQEENLRPGTENIPAIIGFAKAVEIAMTEKEKIMAHIRKLQKKLIDECLKISDTKLNGPTDYNKKICNVANITFKFIEGEALLMLLNEKGICVSTGSACSSKDLKASHVILALGKPILEAHGTIRFSLSKFTTEEDIMYTIEKLKEAVNILRKISHLKRIE